MEKVLKVLANVAQGLTDQEKETARANIGAQGALTAGPNIDIINNTISTEKTVVSAGSNVSVTGSVDQVNRVMTYTVTSYDTKYTAGSGLNLNGTEFSVTRPVPAPVAADEGKVLQVTDAAGGYGWASKTGKRVTFDASEGAPYTRVTAIIAAGNIPVFVVSGQGATRYYELIYSSPSYYTFVCNDSTQFGNKTYYAQVNSDNTISTGDMTSQTPLSFESPWLENDNGTVKAKWPFGTCIGTVNDHSTHHITWTSGMTNPQFNQKLIDLPLPAAGLYVVHICGNGKYTDPSGVATSSQLLRFRVCNGDQTAAVNTVDGLAQIPLDTTLGFCCQLLVPVGATPANTLTLNVSDDDYAPQSGQSQTLDVYHLNVIWVRYPL